MPSEPKLEKLIVQIIRQTTEGKIEWDAIDPPRSLTMGSDDVIQDYFQTEYKDQRIAVFERKYQTYDGEHDVSFWVSRICLAFVAADGSISWETSELPFRLSALFKAAKESAADVDGIVDSLLD